MNTCCRERLTKVFKDIECYLGSTYFSRKDFKKLFNKHMELEDE